MLKINKTMTPDGTLFTDYRDKGNKRLTQLLSDITARIREREELS
ncbi:hypothetical protein [Ruminococcus sp.]|nr:hypothetical protein [Ruminococcus sp.]